MCERMAYVDKQCPHGMGHFICFDTSQYQVSTPPYVPDEGEGLTSALFGKPKPFTICSIFP